MKRTEKNVLLSVVGIWLLLLSACASSSGDYIEAASKNVVEKLSLEETEVFEPGITPTTLEEMERYFDIQMDRSRMEYEVLERKEDGTLQARIVPKDGDVLEYARKYAIGRNVMYFENHYDSAGVWEKQVTVRVIGGFPETDNYRLTKMDKDGTILVSYSFEGEGEHILRSYTRYQKGKVISRASFDVWTQTRESISVIDPESGLQVKECYCDAEGHIERYTSLIYDENKVNVVKRCSYNVEDVLQSYIEYEYNESGQELKALNYDAEGVLQSYLVREYDEKGTLVKILKYDSNDVLIDTMK